jgi:hypothetical protein
MVNLELLNPSQTGLYHSILEMGEEMRNLVEMFYLLLGIFSVYCVVSPCLRTVQKWSLVSLYIFI